MVLSGVPPGEGGNHLEKFPSLFIFFFPSTVRACHQVQLLCRVKAAEAGRR